MSFLFNTFIYKPLYNAFILLADLAPFLDVGILVIIFTVAVKSLLYPLAKKAFVAREELKVLAPKLQAVKDKYANDKEAQAKELMAVYASAKTNPFSSIFLVLLQLPIILALYFILIRSGLPSIDYSLLYSFVSFSGEIKMHFLGFVNIAAKNLPLAMLAGITTYIQIRVTTAQQGAPTGKGKGDELARMMQSQMKFMFPILAFVISYSISGVVALYWTTSNIVTLLQEKYIARKHAQKS